MTSTSYVSRDEPSSSSSSSSIASMTSTVSATTGLQQPLLILPPPVSWFDKDESPRNSTAAALLSKDEALAARKDDCCRRHVMGDVNESGGYDSGGEPSDTTRLCHDETTSTNVLQLAAYPNDDVRDGGRKHSERMPKSAAPLCIASVTVEPEDGSRSHFASSHHPPQLPEQPSSDRAPGLCSTTASTATTVATTATNQHQHVGAPHPAPSWKELSHQVMPAAARELLQSCTQRLTYTARLGYSHTTRQHRALHYSDYYNRAAGYDKVRAQREYQSRQQQQQREISSVVRNKTKTEYDDAGVEEDTLPPFSSLPWVDRQLVKEWRTYLPESNNTDGVDTVLQNDRLQNEEEEEGEIEFDRARTMAPVSLPPPLWRHAESCRTCHTIFGPTCLRHHCRSCGHSYCHAHSPYTHALPQFGYTVAERVCRPCKTRRLRQCRAERVAWRTCRCRDQLDGVLTPYFDVPVDSLHQVAQRCANAALCMAKSIPLGAQATVAVETVDVLRKYGLHGMYTFMVRHEFLAAADLLLKALGINRTAWPLSVHELSAAMFYALAQHRAMRGMNPERELWIHATEGREDGRNNNNLPDTTSSRKPVCDHLPDDELTQLIFYAPIALNFIYVEKEVDMQLLAAQQGWRLVYAMLEQEEVSGMAGTGADSLVLHDRPASALFVHEEQKICCVAIRGTSTIQDVITDIRQVPVPFPDPESSTRHTSGKAEEEWTTVLSGQGHAVAGMAGAAVNLYREHIDSIMMFMRKGYRVRITGHSLGGAVATLLGVLVNRDIQELRGDDGVSTNATDEAVAPLRVYAYGTPSCVDLALSESVACYVTTTVLHDDVVPRLSPTSCRGLLKHLLHIRETWVKEHFADDIRAFTDRAKTAWAPKWRGGFTLSVKSSIKLKRYCRKQLQYGKSQLQIMKDVLVGEDQAQPYEGGTIADTISCNTENDTVDCGSGFNVDKSGIEMGEENECPLSDVEPRLVMDFMGGIDVRAEGMVVDGDEFFDPMDHLLDSNDDDSADTNDVIGSSTAPSVCGDPVEVVDSNLLASCNDDPSNNTLKIDSPLYGIESSDVDLEDSKIRLDTPGTVLLEETPLPKMFVPGKIVHIYSYRGVYKAAYVPRDFRELRRISMAGNMLSDHKTKSYYDALLEVSSVRRSDESPPRWTAFDEDDTCSCCASRFTWASTSDNEAQEARDKHNCRSCGTLVCEPCSRNRIPIPSIGLTVSARVCDRCYNDIDGLLTIPSHARPGGTTTASNTSKHETRQQESREAKRPIRLREKRSAVVDELASRVHASALTCN